jgi:hypothetical protein
MTRMRRATRLTNQIAFAATDGHPLSVDIGIVSPAPSGEESVDERLQEIANKARRSDDEAKERTLPHEERAANIIKIELYRLTRELRFKRQLGLLAELLENHRKFRGRPRTKIQPFLGAVLAFSRHYPLTRHQQRVFAYQMYLASENDVPAHLLPGYIWQIGTKQSRPPPGGPYWNAVAKKALRRHEGVGLRPAVDLVLKDPVPVDDEEWEDDEDEGGGSVTTTSR